MYIQLIYFTCGEYDAIFFHTVYNIACDIHKKNRFAFVLCIIEKSVLCMTDVEIGCGCVSSIQ